MRSLPFRILRRSLLHPASVYHMMGAEFRIFQNRNHRTFIPKRPCWVPTLDELSRALSLNRSLPFDEIESIRSLYAELRNRVFKLYEYGGRGRPPSIVSESDATMLYGLTRVTTPRIVVETGVSDGASSIMFLMAMNLNQAGVLHSIDFPEVGLPQLFGKEPGWLIPNRLRDRWQLHLGPSRDVLPNLLSQLGSIDLFFHDSEHSYENMFREVCLAASHTSRGGIIVADDALSNDALWQFARNQTSQAGNVQVSDDGLGVLRIGTP